MILTKIHGGSAQYESWLYINTKEWKWEFNYSTPHLGVDVRVAGVWLEEVDAIAFRLKFGL